MEAQRRHKQTQNSIKSTYKKKSDFKISYTKKSFFQFLSSSYSTTSLVYFLPLLQMVRAAQSKIYKDIFFFLSIFIFSGIYAHLLDMRVKQQFAYREKESERNKQKKRILCRAMCYFNSREFTHSLSAFGKHTNCEVDDLYRALLYSCENVGKIEYEKFFFKKT